MASVLGRVNYDYSNLYYFTFSHRLDASSKFSKENRWAGFSSGSVKWRATNEKWLKDKIDWLSDLSVRFSLGQTGNNRIDGYSTFSTITTGLTQAPFVNGNSIPISAIPSSIGNTNLKWETTTQSNLGVDLSFLKGRISFTADIYQKNTTDLLLNAQLPPFIGYGYAYKNIGSLRNQGLELTINTDNIRTKKFSWTSSFNISFNQSKVLALSENQETLLSVTRWDAQYFSSPSYASKIGQPLGQMYGLVWDGNYGYDDFYQSTALNPAAANVGRGSHWVLKDNVPTNGTARGAIQPGDIKFKDLNGDGIINQDDNTIIGRGTPIHTGGFGNNFTYNGFDLSLFFQWSYGNDIQNVNRMVFEGNVNNSSNFNQFSSYLDRWSSENTNSKNFRVGGQGPSGYYSSRTIEDGSYIRFKTLSFGYNISEQLLKKVKIKSVRVYVSGQNLFTWTKYAGMDPEVSTYNSVLTPGLDWSGYPKALSITGGVNLKF
jgi:TonB-linked SusC/RagA family outer membrane protein